MVENPAPTPPPPGMLGLTRSISHGQLPIDLDNIIQTGDYGLPDETFYMNRANGRIQYYYESTENLWDEETF